MHWINKEQDHFEYTLIKIENKVTEDQMNKKHFILCQDALTHIEICRVSILKFNSIDCLIATLICK